MKKKLFIILISISKYYFQLLVLYLHHLILNFKFYTYTLF